MAGYLDIALDIGEINHQTGGIKATPYFEDYLQNIVTSMGGEGVDLTIFNIASPLIYKLEAMSKRVKDLEQQLKQTTLYRAEIESMRKHIKDLENLIKLDSARSRSLLNGVKPFRVVELAAGDTSYTTRGNEYVICNNTGLATITLNPLAKNKEEAIIIRNAAGGVKVTSSKLISGKTTKTILRRYSAPHHIYTTDADTWSVV